MTGSVFVDTNVLVYARDLSDPVKQVAAHEWLGWLWQERLGRLSGQVLHEYYVTVTRKLVPGLEREVARRDVNALQAWGPLDGGRDVRQRAWAVEDRWGLSWWDSLIIASAQQLGCEVLLTEDLQHGQMLDGLRVVNPFLLTPTDLG